MFKGPASNKTGGDFPIPPAGSHAAVLIGIVDLGTQQTNFGDEIKDTHQVALVWELTSEPMPSRPGRNHVVAQKYTFSFHQKSSLRMGYESWIGRSYADGEEIDYSAKLGHPCAVTIKHGTSAKGNTYAKVDSFGPLMKGTAVNPPTVQPFLYTIADGLSLRDPKTKSLVATGQGDLPASWDWLPFLVGKPMQEVIELSPEYLAKVRGLGAANRAPSSSFDEAGTAETAGSDIPW